MSEDCKHSENLRDEYYECSECRGEFFRKCDEKDALLRELAITFDAMAEASDSAMARELARRIRTTLEPLPAPKKQEE